MSAKEHNKSQPVRELEYLAQFFFDHGREDLAKEIFKEVVRLREKAQESVQRSNSNVINFHHRHEDAKKEG